MHVAIIGAGVMGSCTALLLARRGVRVTVFDAASESMSGASRWNEGKIHLGYLYAGDPSGATVDRLLPGGLAFRPLVEDLLSCSLEAVMTPHDDRYLVHRDSVVGPEAMRRHVDSVTTLAREHPDSGRYLVDLSGATARELPLSTLADEYDTSCLTAAFEVPERSVSTTWLADRFVDALTNSPIEAVMDTRVVAVHLQATGSGPHELELADGARVGPFDVVVNAAWEGRPALDLSMGLPPAPELSHRYRLALFVRAGAEAALRSAVVSTGPFGDVKNYGSGELYLSWYPAGLVAEGEEVEPPAARLPDEHARRAVADATVAGLTGLMPGVRDLVASAAEVRVKGGWVYAAGKGPLSDRASGLHRRERVGITRHHNYVSVDTGKYSIAPWLATQIVADLLD